jgi:hypothetical protein
MKNKRFVLACLVGILVSLTTAGANAEPAGLAWADLRAHFKHCIVEGFSVYHVRCEDSQGNSSTECADLSQDALFRGVPQQKVPRRLDDRAWTQATIADQHCSLRWNHEGMHNKGYCKSGGRVYHARCELPDGTPSLECAALPRGTFGGRKIVGDPVRLADRAWAEVVLEDPECLVSWRDDRAHWKSSNNGVTVFHVRCEDSHGGASTACPDMPQRSFLGRKMAENPTRLSDEAWTEVKVRD